MDIEVIIIVIGILGVGLLFWFALRKSKSSSVVQCWQCGHPVKSGQEMCPFCHAPLDPRQTVFPQLPSVHLAFIEGPRAGQTLTLQGKQIHIGRNPDSQLCIEDSLVSWNHAILTYKNGQYILYDQDSTNGTWVNGRRVAQSAIQLGSDQVRVGPAVFVLRGSAQQVSTPPEAIPQTTNEAAVEKVYDFGDYQRVDTLGGGGAATVYKAISQRDGQIVAIKVLHQSNDPYLRDKFEKEGSDIARLLLHPHIVRVYGGGESQGVLYLVMELMEGGTLRDRISPGSSLAFDQVITWVGQICDALQYAHTCGIYHRDIKPENIFFTADGQAKLGDFGIARLARAITRTASGWLIGTPSYMSVDQAKGRDIDGRSDIYSLGVVMYELVTGRCPFISEDPLRVVDMHIQEKPVPPRNINPNVSPKMEEVIMRSLEKDRERRFRTAEAMARALGYTAAMHAGGRATPYPVQAARSSSAVAHSMSSNHWRLLRSDGFAIPLRSEGVLLGRQSVNPGDPKISRKHAQILRRDTYYWIEDLGSANGTFVNGLRIFSPQLLQQGDEIMLGHTRLQVAQ